MLPKSTGRKLFPYDFQPSVHRGMVLRYLRYTVYRVIMAVIGILLFVILTVYNQYHTQILKKVRKYVKMSTWACFLMTAYFISALVQNTLCKKIWKISHFLFVLSILFVTSQMLLYSCLLVPAGIDNTIFTGPMMHFNIVEHTVPTILLLVDLTQNLICLWNFYQLILLIVVPIFYVLVLAIYTLSMIFDMIDEQIVYNSMTFNDVLTLVVVSVYLCLHFLAYLVWYYIMKWFKMQKVVDVLAEKEGEPVAGKSMKSQMKSEYS